MQPDSGQAFLLKPPRMWSHHLHVKGMGTAEQRERGGEEREEVKKKKKRRERGG